MHISFLGSKEHLEQEVPLMLNISKYIKRSPLQSWHLAWRAQRQRVVCTAPLSQSGPETRIRKGISTQDIRLHSLGVLYFRLTHTGLLLQHLNGVGGTMSRKVQLKCAIIRNYTWHLDCEWQMSIEQNTNLTYIYILKGKKRCGKSSTKWKQQTRT